MMGRCGTACVVSIHIVCSPLAVKRKSRYKCLDVSDPHAKPWLADDPNFLASLGDLDRGLSAGGQVGHGDVGDELVPSAAAQPSVNAAVPARPVPSPAPGRLVPPGAFAAAADADAAPPLAFARPSAAEPRVRRPLLDLFPPSALEAERPPLPAFGTSVGPQLPPPRPRPARGPEPDAPLPLNALTYETFYGLREKPFSLSTDPRFRYQSASHERAGRELLAAIRERSGPAVLTGPLGMGKTTLCRSLVQEIDRRTVTSLVLEPLQSMDDLLKTMLVDFGVVSRADLTNAPQLARAVLTSTLDAFLDSLVPLQASAVVLIDEAQNLPIALLGDLGAALRAGGPEVRVLQLVLVGQPALAAVLMHADLQQLNASVARRTELGPLGADEIAGYVMHRLSIAGAHTRIEFDEAAVARLFARSAGVPRVVNLLCDRAMTRGQQSSAGVIDGALIEAAAVDLDLGAPAGDRPGVLVSLLTAAAFALLVLAGAAGALWVSRDAAGRTMLQWQNIPLAPGGPVRRLPVPLAPIPPPAEIPDAPLRGPAI